MSSETMHYLTRALEELRNASAEYAEARPNGKSADALYDLVRTTQSVRERIEPDAVSGKTNMTPAGALVVGDELIGPGGVTASIVVAVARTPYRCDVQTWDPMSNDGNERYWTSYDRDELVEVAVCAE